MDPDLLRKRGVREEAEPLMICFIELPHILKRGFDPRK